MNQNGKNGIDVTDISTNNTFNNCVALNNNGSGIKTFGNFNEHNVFNNCTAKYNTDGQFGQGPDSFGNYGDYYNSINGGVFCCARGSNSIITLASQLSTMSGAAVSDDDGLASDGLVVESNYATVTNNTFTNFKGLVDVFVKSGLATLTYCGNNAPDGTTPSLEPQHCAAASSCDLNWDGVVNILDVQIAINQVLGVVQCGNADLMQTGFCTAIDIQRVINAALGSTCKTGL